MGGAGLVLYISFPQIQEAVLSPIFPEAPRYVHPRLSLWRMSLDHLVITLAATGISFVIGGGLGIFLTRSAGKDFLRLVNRLTSLVQTLPPSAVIILAYPDRKSVV
jgi:osmoprotectant transport system permease protein